MSRNNKKTQAAAPQTTTTAAPVAEGPATFIGQVGGEAHKALAATLAAEKAPTLPEHKAERHTNRRKFSTLSSPVATVKLMFTEMRKANPNMSRKDMISLAIDSGIAMFTARTQYQIWKNEGKEAAPIDAKPELDLGKFINSLAPQVTTTASLLVDQHGKPFASVG